MIQNRCRTHYRSHRVNEKNRKKIHIFVRDIHFKQDINHAAPYLVNGRILVPFYYFYHYVFS